MTVPSTEYKGGPYVCDGEQTEFPFHFPVLDASHIQVWKDGAIVVLGYTVNLEESGGGTVVFSSAPEEGSKVAIIRDVPITQLTDLQNNTAFLPEILETEYDKGAMIDQMLAEILSRCLKVSPTDDALDFSGIVAELRAAVAEAKNYADLAKQYAEQAASGVISVDSSLSNFIEVYPAEDGSQRLYLANGGTDHALVVTVQYGGVELLETHPCVAESTSSEV